MVWMNLKTFEANKTVHIRPWNSGNGCMKAPDVEINIFDASIVSFCLHHDHYNLQG